MDWHLRLSHLKIRDIARLAKGGRLDGLSVVTSSDVQNFECSLCIFGEGRPLPSPPFEDRATEPLAVVHIDLWDQLLRLLTVVASTF